MKIGKYDISITGRVMIVTDSDSGSSGFIEVTEYDLDYWAEEAAKNGQALTDHLIAIFDKKFADDGRPVTFKVIGKE